MNSQASKAIAYTIGKFLKQQMPSLKQVWNGWPESNLAIQYPSMTVFTVDPGYTHEMNPYQYKATQKKDADYEFKWVVGEYNTNLQLDIWCTSKEERYRLIDEFQRAILAQFDASLGFPDLGLLIELEDYHEIICRYDVVNYNFDTDNEVGSQTKEWRVKIDLLAHCKAIVNTREFAILQTEIDVEDVNQTVEIE